VLQQQNGNGLEGYPSSGMSAADTYADIRYDEHYEKFYQSAAAGDSGLKLPPPLEQRTLYHDLPRFSQPQGGDAAAGLRPSSAVGLNGSYAGALHSSCFAHLWRCLQRQYHGSLTVAKLSTGLDSIPEQQLQQQQQQQQQQQLHAAGLQAGLPNGMTHPMANSMLQALSLMCELPVLPICCHDPHREAEHVSWIILGLKPLLLA
jgi:hypothetical protein